MLVKSGLIGHNPLKSSQQKAHHDESSAVIVLKTGFHCLCQKTMTGKVLDCLLLQLTAQLHCTPAQATDPNSDWPEPALKGAHLEGEMRRWLPQEVRRAQS